MSKKSELPPLEIREFRSPGEIDSAVEKLRRRIKEVEGLDVVAAVTQHSGRDQVVTSTIRSTILEIFGENSPEYPRSPIPRAVGRPHVYQHASEPTR
jgi:hypothetical protein